MQKVRLQATTILYSLKYQHWSGLIFWVQNTYIDMYVGVQKKVCMWNVEMQLRVRIKQKNKIKGKNHKKYDLT